jgi:peptidylprolyl isomerase domain and WD repeat-containing protein 1
VAASDEDTDSGDDGPMPMPAEDAAEGAGTRRKKPRRLAHEAAFLDKLPAAEMYEKSYMHRDTVTHCVVTNRTDFVVTASSDGHVKFWKKMVEGVEFVKHFHAHLGHINALVASADGQRVATTGSDKAVKFFEVVSFDLSSMLRLAFEPTAAAWCHARGSPVGRIAVASLEEPLVRV